MEDEHFIDVDRIILEPSPQRIRNILTLEERVRAIQAYDCRPMYTKVAKMFNCSWEQIKNIIANREAIMGFYAATKNVEQNTDPNQDEIRQRKIAFLGACMYEYIQRFQFHKKVDLTEELIRMKALEFRDVMGIENFIPNKVWINHFKATYNFSLSNRQIMLTRTPPSSLDLKDIMMYCTKNKSKTTNVSITQPKIQNLYRTTTQIAVSNANDAALEELVQRRKRKIDFLERALSEFMTRYHYYRRKPLRDAELLKETSALKEILKIDNFVPDQKWLNAFKTKYAASSQNITKGKRPLISLDLKDILSYCGRKEGSNSLICNDSVHRNKVNKQNSLKRTAPSSIPSAIIDSTITSDSAVSSKTPRISPLIELNGLQETSVKTEVIDLDKSESEIDIKPSIFELEQSLQQEQDLNAQSTSHSIKIEEEKQNATHSPGHWSEYSDKDNEELPKHVENYKDALKLLKPLEEFAMLEENYRAIGLISQLENIFKTSKKNLNNS